MGLKLKSQIMWILFGPMSLVIIVLSYFNITILENTLILNSTQSTASSVRYITEWVKRIIPTEEDGKRYFSKLGENQSQAISKYLTHFEELRSFKLINNQGAVVYSFGQSDDEMTLKNSLFMETFKSHVPTSHLWAYRDAEDLKGEPVTRAGFLGNKILSFEYFEPVVKNGTLQGVIYLSFHVRKVTTLLKLIALGNISLVLIFLLSTFIAISIWSDNAVKRPLDFIFMAQEKLGKGDFDVRIDLGLVHTNELARAYGSFNRMADDLKSSREELERKNIRLAELNEQYRRLNERLEQEVKEKTDELREFFSLITHDLKVPLAASQGYTELLLKPKTGELNEKQRKFITCISMAHSHLLHLVRNMLDSVKYDSGKINYYFEQFSLPVLVDEVRSNLHHFLEEREIVLKITIPSSCEQIYGDRMKIGQVLTNLISNAITVSRDRDSLILSARDCGDSVEISLSDSGPGISKENLISIFDRFTQFPEGEKPSGSLGLGLYIVKKVLEGHNQEIRVESEKGKGSVFTFTLPKEGKALQE